ncbi:MAG: peptidyl-prolyl cis-trans isomerase [Myxococcaceae bacterium]
MHHPNPSLLLAALTLSAAACDRTPATPAPREAAPVVDLVATVNGAPITEADLLLKLKTDTRETEMQPGFRKNMLEAVIAQEVRAQKAVELGLDADPGYQAGVRDLDAQLKAYRRRALAELFERREISAKAAVSETEAKDYFEKNAGRLRTQVHVLQIMTRNEAAAEGAHAAIAKGTAFEEVARGLSPPMPDPAATPWDLGFLPAEQVPPAWHGPLAAMKPGEVSGIIRGPKERFWVIKLVESRENPEVTFESVKPALLERLKGIRTEELREQASRELREKAKVVYSNPAP